jgi:hypothetical protein
MLSPSQTPIQHVPVSDNSEKTMGYQPRKRKSSRQALEGAESSPPIRRRRQSRAPAASPILTPGFGIDEIDVELGEIDAVEEPPEVVAALNAVDYRPGRLANILTAFQIKDSCKAALTWKKYYQHWRRFYRWLEANGHGRFLLAGRNQQNRRELFTSIRLPIPVHIFEAYITDLVHKKDNTLKDISVPHAFWAALVYAHDISSPLVNVPQDLRHGWNQYIAGYKRVQPLQVVDLGLTVYEGKDSLSRLGYMNLQRLTLEGACSPSQMMWVPQMNAGTRNLVARVNFIGQLISSTIRWKNDCMLLGTIIRFSPV